MIAEFGTFEYSLADHYRFERELGRGAMGTVYQARDLRLERPVAIKMLHRVLTTELGAVRFQSEVRIAAALHHPNIVGVHEYDEVDGRLFYVMDYLEGESLRSRLAREKRLPEADALEITTQVADALQHAHDHGVVPRALKPENIMLSRGRAWVVDFGLALAVSRIDAKRLTASGISVGTPQYLSPEQAAAEKAIGPAADQYALACVLYEMLAGEPPFMGPTATAVAMRHVLEIPPLVRTRSSATPIPVESAIARALAKTPAERHADIQAFAVALRAARTSPPVASFGTARQALPSVALRLALFLVALAVTIAIVRAR